VLTHDADEDYERGRELDRAGRAAAVTVLPPRSGLGLCRRARARRGGAGRRLPARAAPPRSGEFEVLLVLDRCTDATEQRARDAARRTLTLHVLQQRRPASGRRAALGHGPGVRAAARARRADGLIASTDADSQAEPDWLARQAGGGRARALAIGGPRPVGDERSARRRSGSASSTPPPASGPAAARARRARTSTISSRAPRWR
jgi:hypothetical protein